MIRDKFGTKQVKKRGKHKIKILKTKLLQNNDVKNKVQLSLQSKSSASRMGSGFFLCPHLCGENSYENSFFKEYPLQKWKKPSTKLRGKTKIFVKRKGKAYRDSSPFTQVTQMQTMCGLWVEPLYSACVVAAAGAVGQGVEGRFSMLK